MRVRTSLPETVVAKTTLVPMVFLSQSVRGSAVENQDRFTDSKASSSSLGYHCDVCEPVTYEEPRRVCGLCESVVSKNNSRRTMSYHF